jgi:hypothetical protein
MLEQDFRASIGTVPDWRPRKINSKPQSQKAMQHSARGLESILSPKLTQDVSWKCCVSLFFGERAPGNRSLRWSRETSSQPHILPTVSLPTYIDFLVWSRDDINGRPIVPTKE